MYMMNELLREDTASTLRILVATDCHLGYMEKDEIRRHDSFQAFDEICSVAEQKKVMMNLLLCSFLSATFSCRFVSC